MTSQTPPEHPHAPGRNHDQTSSHPDGQHQRDGQTEHSAPQAHEPDGPIDSANSSTSGPEGHDGLTDVVTDVVVIPHERERPLRLERVELSALIGAALPPGWVRVQAEGERLGAVLLGARPDPQHQVGPAQQCLRLPENERATWFAWLHDRRIRFRGRFHGDAYLVGRRSEGQVYGDVPEEVLEHLLQSWAYQVQITSPASPHLWAPCSTGYTSWERAYEHALHLSALQGAVTDVRVLHLAPDRQVQLWVQIARKHLRRHHGSTLVAGPSDVGELHEFDQADLVVCWSVQQLAQAIDADPIQAGAAFRYGDLCLVNLAEHEERWLLIHGSAAFEVTPLRPCIAAGVFDSLISAITALPPSKPVPLPRPARG